jgi:hypothetical protein
MNRCVIDPKYHVEDGRVVKTSNGQLVPEDEPLILFRARDRLALQALEAYLVACLDDGCTQYQLDGINDRIQAFRAYREFHQERMKQPGSTMGR